MKQDSAHLALSAIIRSSLWAPRIAMRNAERILEIGSQECGQLGWPASILFFWRCMLYAGPAPEVATFSNLLT